MWCKNCKQDVPGVRGESFESIRCARCQQELASARSIKSRVAQQPSSISFAEWQYGNLPDLLESAAELRREAQSQETASKKDSRSADTPASASAANRVEDDQLQEFDAEIRRIDRIINLWGQPRYLRFDSAHNGPHAKSNKEKVQVVSRIDADDEQDAVRPNLLAVCLTFGGLLAIVLGAAHAISHGQPQWPKDIRIAAGFVSAGALSIIAGLWYEIGRLKRKLNHLIAGNSDD